ncbi:spermidine/putrescine ABC transporter ATP-binding protein [Rathayibacter sp. AY1E9]|uniref:ABC transporter ATP-binding protein n=1 Tax=unclassified Rathayibacter TaxID=2609250 RepID=UPI000CE7ECB1|nr:MULTISPECIES: ABC transporter ATP-binding protein [unclassified Rathayibacter]PPF12835.1 spermidine/putrescine ABC transporter ATP-binding protein [Rathayibacter sp. AY1A5]PPG21105.1 spermidine/putrescine ABC transporter ATP-binding protein [Rathayibacter sp. AY1E8]PPG55109.1 spermidine/putrescine ABC transporter ATP-binding protein [Rathayibacter sp. AY1E9]PPG61541.1 spermidine/putrescine ABC transporter ATP-binding protein [Rathayibacter sp. AY1C5]PPH42381.1 spermidine/putrescine ABC tran
MAIGTFAESGADLQLVGISKQYPGFTAIDSLDLTIPAGSFFALLGPSGCGKTTTLRLVAGLEEPSAGRILIGGRDVTETKTYQRPVNTVFQSYALFPHMSILENVAFGLKRRRIADPVGKAHEALRLVELDHLAQRRPAQLSGGQQQRVALARALVNRPALLLLDEPLGALDLKLRRQMQLELKSIQEEVGLTFLHVTHDQEEAMTMADTVAVMNKGRIEQMGAPEELYELPRTAFVANFLGQSNLFTGEVVGSTDRALTVDAGGHRIVVPVARCARTSGEITVGVRPEKLLLLTQEPPPDSGRNVLGPGRVVDVSFSGVSTQYTIRMPGLGPVVVFAQNMVFGPVVGEGAEVWVGFSAEHGFGLADEPGSVPRFEADDSTSAIAVQRRGLLAGRSGGA